MNEEALQSYAGSRGLSLRDSLQTFLQVIVLKNLSDPKSRLIGGTALVLGHENPRFSEDLDFTEVPDPSVLERGLQKSVREISGWLGHPVRLETPKKGGRTWKLSCQLSRAETLRLHVDCQEFPAHTTAPIVVQFPSLPPFVCEAVSLDEILADKAIALACRRYLGGRDLFDLWFHWLKADSWRDRLPVVQTLLSKKLEERSLERSGWLQRLEDRLSPTVSLGRARTEWKRYLPRNFQRADVQSEIFEASRRLLTELT